MPIATSILDVVEAIKKQITDKAVGMSGTASPQAQEPPQQLTPEPPPDVDYTAGMQRPELTKLASNMEFKATPSRATAMLVALGNILQDKRNVEAAKQAAQQSDYDARFKDALDLTKARKGMQMKREFDESDPDTQLRRELLQTELAQKKEMFPLEKQYKQTALDRLLMKGTMGGGGGRGRSGGGEMPTEEMPAGFQAILAANTSTYDPVTREPRPTRAELEFSYRKYLTTNPKPKDRIIADKYRSSLMGEMPKPEKEQKAEKVSTTEQNIRSYMELFGVNRIDAIKMLNEDVSASRGKGSMKGTMSAINEMDGGTTEETPSPQAPPAKPQSAYAPGTILKVRGKLMKVINAQGDLQEVK